MARFVQQSWGRFMAEEAIAWLFRWLPKLLWDTFSPWAENGAQKESKTRRQTTTHPTTVAKSTATVAKFTPISLPCPKSRTSLDVYEGVFKDVLEECKEMNKSILEKCKETSESLDQINSMLKENMDKYDARLNKCLDEVRKMFEGRPDRSDEASYKRLDKICEVQREIRHV